VGLLRKNMLDDAGTRVPMYRSPFWPGLLGYENRIPEDEAADLFLSWHRERWGRDPVRSPIPDRLSRVGLWVLVALGIAYWFLVGWLFPPLIGMPRTGGAMIVPLVLATLIAVIFCQPVRRPAAFFGTEPFRRAYLRAGRCPSCGYELAGQEICPECAAVWRTKKRLPAKGSRSEESQD